MIPNHFGVKCSIAVPYQVPHVRPETRQDAPGGYWLER